MYTLSEKQKLALVNMGKVVGKGEEDIDDYFIDKDSFQKYFDGLKEQIDKKIKSQKRQKNFQNAVKLGKVDLEKVKENQKAKILNYYSQPQVLKSKGIEYHIKYSTSKKKLREWMLNKTQNNIDLVDQVLSTCKICEEIFITPIVQSGIKKGLSSFDISCKLQQKGFDQILSQQIIDQELKSGEVQLNPNVVHIKIRELLRKGQSEYNIRSEIKYKFSLTTQQVDEYLKEYDFEDNQQGDLKLMKEIESLRKKGKKDFEIIGICLSKKFDYKKIQEMIKTKK